MQRIEIIANRSVEAELLDALESAVPDFNFTLLPVVHGKGRQLRRMGTPIWPEENFLLISYLEDSEAAAAAEAVALLKTRFPNEGIKLFSLSEKV